MPDIICPLFDLPSSEQLLKQLSNDGITVRPARPWERTRLSDFISENFYQTWADETLDAFSKSPITTIIALDGDKIVGFASYNVTAPGYFGPTGVDKAYRGLGIGKAILFEALHGLRQLGYVYGFIGAPGPVDFYVKNLKCMLLPKDWTTIYTSTQSITQFQHISDCAPEK